MSCKRSRGVEDTGALWTRQSGQTLASFCCPHTGDHLIPQTSIQPHFYPLPFCTFKADKFKKEHVSYIRRLCLPVGPLVTVIFTFDLYSLLPTHLYGLWQFWFFCPTLALIKGPDYR